MTREKLEIYSLFSYIEIKFNKFYSIYNINMFLVVILIALCLT